MMKKDNIQQLRLQNPIFTYNKYAHINDLKKNKIVMNLYSNDKLFILHHNLVN